jgi:hypothetical protein
MITITVSDNDWVRYSEKYEGLMWTIARKISGDRVIADLETNYADLCVAALDSIRGFHKKTGEDFPQMMDNTLFDKYTKTVLWNYKNKKGNYLKKRYSLNSSAVEIGEEFSPSSKSVGEYNSYMDSLLNKCGKFPKSLMDDVCKNPEKIEECMDLIAECFEEG